MGGARYVVMLGRVAGVDVDGYFWTKGWGSVHRRHVVTLCLDGAYFEGVFLVTGEDGVKVEVSNVSDDARGRVLFEAGERVLFEAEGRPGDRCPVPSKLSIWAYKLFMRWVRCANVAFRVCTDS